MSANSTSNSTRFVVPAPSNDDSSGADLVLISSDGHRFFAQSSFLSVASPVFGDMLSIPQPPSSEDATSLKEVSLPEPASALLAFLRWLHPKSPPSSVPESIESVGAVLSMMEKYGIEHMGWKVGGHLGFMIEEAPVRVYTLAIRYEIPQVARAAARASLAIPIRQKIQVTPESSLVTGTAVQRLLEYHYACVSAANLAVDQFGAFEDRCFCDYCVRKMTAIQQLKAGVKAELGQTPYAEKIAHLGFHNIPGCLYLIAQTCTAPGKSCLDESLSIARDKACKELVEKVREAVSRVELVID